MRILTGDSRYEDAANSLKEKKGGVTMCNAMESAELKGRTEERIKAIQNLMRLNQDKRFILELGYTETEYQQAEQALLVTV